MGSNHHLYAKITDDFIKNIKMVRGINRIMHKWAGNGELCRLLYDETGGAGFPPADMEVGNVYLMVAGQFFEYVMVP
jgi:hypothetical protein